MVVFEISFVEVKTGAKSVLYYSTFLCGFATIISGDV